MTGRGRLAADDQSAERRFGQPTRHAAPQDAGLVHLPPCRAWRRRLSGATFAGYDQHGPQSTGNGALNETDETPMSGGLRHAVKVESGLDLDDAGRYAPRFASIDSGNCCDSPRPQRRRRPIDQVARRPAAHG
jgi:hypothetical protein